MSRKAVLACKNAILWNLADTCAATSLSPSQIKREERNRDFPSSFLIGKRRKAWLRDEVEAWCKARAAAARSDDAK